jgi:hypothetical protein
MALLRSAGQLELRCVMDVSTFDEDGCILGYDAVLTGNYRH